MTVGGATLNGFGEAVLAAGALAETVRDRLSTARFQSRNDCMSPAKAAVGSSYDHTQNVNSPGIKMGRLYAPSTVELQQTLELQARPVPRTQFSLASEPSLIEAFPSQQFRTPRQPPRTGSRYIPS